MSGEAHDLFELGPNYTLDDLKLKFRDLVLKYHPSKTNDTKMFEYVKKCYAKLSEELKNSKKSGFNIDNFNKDFIKYKPPNVYDDGGYDTWIETTATQAGDVEQRAIVHNKEPEPLYTNMSGLGGSEFYELGVGNIENFSGKSGRDLEFMDYRLAHTTSALVDEMYVKKPTYKTFDDINDERSKLSYNISESEQNAEIENKKQLEAFEQKRLATLKRQDLTQEKVFNRLTKKHSEI